MHTISQLHSANPIELAKECLIMRLYTPLCAQSRSTSFGVACSCQKPSGSNFPVFLPLPPVNDGRKEDFHFTPFSLWSLFEGNYQQEFKINNQKENSNETER